MNHIIQKVRAINPHQGDRMNNINIKTNVNIV